MQESCTKHLEYLLEHRADHCVQDGTRTMKNMETGKKRNPSTNVTGTQSQFCSRVGSGETRSRAFSPITNSIVGPQSAAGHRSRDKRPGPLSQMTMSYPSSYGTGLPQHIENTFHSTVKNIQHITYITLYMVYTVNTLCIHMCIISVCLVVYA